MHICDGSLDSGRQMTVGSSSSKMANFAFLVALIFQISTEKAKIITIAVCSSSLSFH